MLTAVLMSCLNSMYPLYFEFNVNDTHQHSRIFNKIVSVVLNVRLSCKRLFSLLGQ